MSFTAFSSLHARAISHLTSVLNSKLNDSFEDAGYDWTATQRRTTASHYLPDMINWLMTVVDGLDVQDNIKEEVYRGALAYIAENFMVREGHSQIHQ